MQSCDFNDSVVLYGLMNDEMAKDEMTLSRTDFQSRLANHQCYSKPCCLCPQKLSCSLPSMDNHSSLWVMSAPGWHAAFSHQWTWGWDPSTVQSQVLPVYPTGPFWSWNSAIDSFLSSSETATESVISLNPPWTAFFQGETVTLTCYRYGFKLPQKTKWYWNGEALRETKVHAVKVSTSGKYRCQADDLHLSISVHLHFYKGEMEEK